MALQAYHGLTVSPLTPPATLSQALGFVLGMVPPDLLKQAAPSAG